MVNTKVVASDAVCYTDNTMKIRVALILDTLHALALSLWLGGLSLMVGVVLPVAVSAKEWPPSALLLPVISVLGPILELCGLTMLGIHFVLRRRYQRSRPHFVADGVRQLMAFGAFFLAEFVRYSLFPIMASAENARFMALASQYSSMAVVQLVLLVGITGITAWLALPPVAVTRATSEPAPVVPTRSAAKK